LEKIMHVMKHGFINIYRSGWYHREGKPGNLDRHGGDVYDTMDQALQDIDPPSHYIATIGITWVDVEDVKPNPADSVPVGLAISRARARREQEEMVEELA
jgi:hypothetical protein